MKKLFMGLLVAILALTVVACGGKQNGDAYGGKEDTNKTSSNLYYGDSLFKGLPEVAGKENVITSDGGTPMFALKDVDKIVSKKPKDLYFLLGLNSLYFPVKDPVNKTLTDYEKLIKTLKEKSPEMKIHVLSVPPVTAKALQKEPKFKNIPRLNKGLKALSKKENVDYIDLSGLLKDQSDLRGKDGVHFTKEFYQKLLDDLENNKKSQ
ncbi:Lysophospholipase L1 [Marininema mesophilum]|uniref:Lysophospholipase L1 n=1 Tax=Marininema mesophilum TaxID=1048340 RepID=A0A1H2ZLL2_9BACL|nr:GDSL-type esterase/lipase family protein [Marininema mesophilum]SDX17754.1 Lysophospholipase L1 [Marininema mesophilum]